LLFPIKLIIRFQQNEKIIASDKANFWSLSLHRKEKREMMQEHPGRLANLHHPKIFLFQVFNKGQSDHNTETWA
jgi:hypothetical protein